MKLNDSFLGVKWEREGFLKDFYKREHTSERQMNMDPAMLGATEIERKLWLLGRLEAVNELINSKGVRLYYITENAQKEASLIKYDIANMKWLRQIKDQRSMYVTSKTEFYRFTKTGDRIIVLQYSKQGEGLAAMIQYEGFALDLKEEELKMLPTQNQEIAHHFIKLIVYIELSKIEPIVVAPGNKVKYGRGGEDKLLNDTSLKNVYLVNAHWNKIVVVKGGFKVSGHFRIQPCGIGRKDYRLIWIDEYEKGSYIRRSGREIRDNR